MTSRATYEAAMNAPDHHRLESGVGYLKVGPLTMPSNGDVGNCNPPPRVADMSVHLLKPPHSDAGITFIWNATRSMWITINSNSKRLGYPPDYLSRNGWSYVRPD